MRIFRNFLTISALLALTACSGVETGPSGTNPRHDNVRRDREAGGGVFSGEGGLVDLFSSSSESSKSGYAGIGVNAYLWRASLDTISFMPLTSADPFGGVIITDWYSAPEARNERIKVNIFILSRDLRSDGLRTSVFRQNLDEQGIWREAEVSPETRLALENAILQRARELRARGLGNIN